jgi:hypothetical protein
MAALKVLNFGNRKEQDRPVFTTSKNGRWIDYGKDNNYPAYLLDVFHNKSNKHKAIISKKVDMTTGNGIVAPITTALQEFSKNKWNNSDLEQIAIRLNYDLEIMNGFSLFVKWSIDGQKVVEVEWLPFHKCRLSECEQYILVSKDWSNTRKNDNKPVTYKRFDARQTSEFKTQIFYHVELSNGIDYYPLPYYSSTLNWIELDFEISNFHLCGVRNGFSPSFMLNIATGIPTDEDMDLAYRQLERKFAGTSNANKLLVTYSEGKEQEPSLVPIQMNDSDERFILIHKEMMTEIFIGHSVTSPMLFGIREAGSLGGKSELLEALAIFQSTYINGKQSIIEKELNKIAAFAGVTEKIVFADYEIDFTAITDTSDETTI